MRHSNTNKKFGRTTGQRRAFIKSLARNLLIKGSIQTTEARAKAIRPVVEKLITRGKTDTLTNRRLLISALGDERVASKAIKTAANYQDRDGGYLRIVKLGARKGDASPMAVIEFV